MLYLAAVLDSVVTALSAAAGDTYISVTDRTHTSAKTERDVFITIPLQQSAANETLVTVLLSVMNSHYAVNQKEWIPKMAGKPVMFFDISVV